MGNAFTHGGWKERAVSYLYCPLGSHRMATSLSPNEETSTGQLEMPSLRACHCFLPSGMRLICPQYITGTYFHRGLLMASSIQSCFHSQGEFLALAGNKGIDIVPVRSYVHLPSGGGTTHAWRSWPICSEVPSAFVHMVQGMKVTISV